MPESPPTTGTTQKRSSQEMEVEEADLSLGNPVPPVKREKKDLMDIDDEVDQSPRKSPKKSLDVPSSAEKDRMETDEGETTQGEPPAKATNSVKKVKEESIESDEDEKTKEKSSATTPIKKTRKLLNHFPYSNENEDEEEEEEESPVKAPPKKGTKVVDDDFDILDDSEEEEEEVPSATRATRAATAKLKIKDEFVSDDEDSAEFAAAKPSNEKEVKRSEKARKEFTKKWLDQTSNIDVEHPIPQKRNPEHFCWYDLTEDWNELILPLAIPTDYDVDTRFKFGVKGYVPLPFSNPQGVRPIGTSNRPRGELIPEALKSFANGVRDLQHLEAGIRTYWSDFNARTLRKMFAGASAELQQEYLSTITGIARIARRSTELVTKPLPSLTYEGDVKSVSMSQEQAACLLAYAFFCTVMPRNGDQYNHFSFHFFHIKSSPIYIEKMKFILFYFKTVIDEMPRGTLTFSRQEWIGKADDREGYDKWEDPLSDMLVLSEGLIEEMDGCLQVDFANQYIGGGVMSEGAVQEEIRFLCCPEMLVSLMLCDRMEPSEAILIQGAQQYSAYTGYAASLKHKPLKLRRSEPRDIYGRARSYLVAIDAVRFTRKDAQYGYRNIMREIKKAYAGFMRDKEAPARPIATGNWGCGVFGGDKELKSLIQWIAASKAGRPLIYITFKDAPFAEGLQQIIEYINEFDIKNGDLVSLLLAYYQNRATNRQGVFSFIRDALHTGSTNLRI